MARKQWSCPNCDSELCSAIRFWKEKQTDFIDMYICHDCGQAADPSTRDELPVDWQPPRQIKKKSKLAPGQVDIFGEIANIRDVIDPVPRMVESPAGIMIGVCRIPEGSNEQYKTEINKMMLEVNTKHSGRQAPPWFKYRKIKRGKKL